MHIDLTRDEIETLLESVDMWQDSCIDTNRELEGPEQDEQTAYIDKLGTLMDKLRDALEGRVAG